jgi:hypothetical protein
MGKAVMAKG